MEVRFSPDKEARLQKVAARAGKDPSQLVEEAVDRMLEYDAHFIAVANCSIMTRWSRASSESSVRNARRLAHFLVIDFPVS
jgi:predicted DNA-binding protein